MFDRSCVRSHHLCIMLVPSLCVALSPSSHPSSLTNKPIMLQLACMDRLGRNSVQASAFIWRTQAATTQTLTVHFNKQTTWSLSRHTQASVYLSAEMLLWDLCGFIWPKIKCKKSSSSVWKENYALFFQQSIVHQDSNQDSALELFA